ncbi:proton pump-interactor BIP131 [Lactuca sativa]|uniref:Uncharacterized protein n=1 Tax=Lactuca sativa TaxID=4236 RepID=A0A9R1WY39_LACSA|nr:proton pump-interactor BIP131 [Lactuca sativa]KAJ0192066.1 hypothetical protein LSAT_V11C800442620 [Lactuca sativa]
MEEHKECDAIGSQSQNRNHIHRVYFVKFQPFPNEIEKEEADNQYKLLDLAQSRINKDINRLKADELQINRNLDWFSRCDEYIQWKRREIESTLQGCQGKVEPNLLEKHDQKRCHKRLIKKGKLDTEYLQQVQEELLSSKKSGGMNSCGRQQLKYLVKTMAQRIQHGNTNSRADEMIIYHETKNVNETREILYTAPESEPHSHWHSRERKSKRDIDCERAMQHKIKIRLDDIEDMKMDLRGRKARVARLKADLELVRKSISCLQKELEDVNTKRSKAYKRAYELGEKKKGLRYANALIRQGDVVGLKQVCETQVQGFMRQWTKSKAFRDDYEKRKPVSKS